MNTTLNNEKTDNVLNRTISFKKGYAISLLVIWLFVGIVISVISLIIARLLDKYTAIDGDIVKYILLFLSAIIMITLTVMMIDYYKKYASREMYFTADKFCIKSGFVKILTADAPIDKILQVNYSCSLLQRIFKCGAVSVATSGIVNIFDSDDEKTKEINQKSQVNQGYSDPTYVVRGNTVRLGYISNYDVFAKELLKACEHKKELLIHEEAETQAIELLATLA